jgi:hypothetical protein
LLRPHGEGEERGQEFLLSIYRLPHERIHIIEVPEQRPSGDTGSLSDLLGPRGKIAGSVEVQQRLYHGLPIAIPALPPTVEGGFGGRH